MVTNQFWQQADLQTESDCCGKGLCEIKCPESIKDQEPYIDNVTYLKENDGTIVLDHKHAYFFQIQGQMKILKREFCDFYVYTHHGRVCGNTAGEANLILVGICHAKAFK